METSNEVSEKAVETEGRSPEETEQNTSKKAGKVLHYKYGIKWGPIWSLKKGET